jgi:hypothetical protein
MRRNKGYDLRRGFKRNMNMMNRREADSAERMHMIDDAGVEKSQ